MFPSNSMELCPAMRVASTSVDWYDSSRMIYLVWSAVSTKRHLAGIFELRVVCLSANPSVCRKTCQYRAYLALLSNRLKTNVVERKKLAVKKYPRICSQRPRYIELRTYRISARNCHFSPSPCCIYLQGNLDFSESSCELCWKPHGQSDISQGPNWQASS